MTGVQTCALPILVPDLPVDALRGAGTRDEVADALLGFAERIAPAAALLVMRKGTVAGHDGRGPSLDREALKQVSIGLEQPSLFRDVVQSQLPYRGPLTDSPAHRAVHRALGQLSGDVLLLPISVSGKVIAVLFASGIIAPLPEASLRELAEEAGQAYERILRSSRR